MSLYLCNRCVCDDTVKKLIYGLVDYMIEKNIVMSVKFPQYLDVV